jgi:hypothetical protein
MLSKGFFSKVPNTDASEFLLYCHISPSKQKMRENPEGIYVWTVPYSGFERLHIVA